MLDSIAVEVPDVLGQLFPGHQVGDSLAAASRSGPYR